MNNENRKGYKAFKPGLICAPDEDHIKQYAENTVFEESGGEICGEGMMHYCTYPLGVLAYYPPVCADGTGFTEYAEVEALDEPVTDDGIKYAAKKLRVGEKISFGNLVKASVKYVLDRVDKTKNGTGNRSGNSQTGYRSSNSQTGNYSGNSQTGYRSYSEQHGAFSASVSTGYGCSHYAAGKQCIAVAWGANSTAKGKKGSYICLAEWNEERTEIINAKFAEIDGEIIKEDTFYKLVDGEFVEVTV